MNVGVGLFWALAYNSGPGPLAGGIPVFYWDVEISCRFTFHEQSTF